LLRAADLLITRAEDVALTFRSAALEMPT